MLLRAEPVKRQRNLAPVTAEQSAPDAALREPLVEQSERDEPPQSRVDAAQVPEIGFAPVRRDELRDLAVRRLIRRERLEARYGARSSVRFPETAMPSAQIAASRPKIAV